MDIELDYPSFCKMYYKDARKDADIAIAKQIEKEDGLLNSHIDFELVKDLAISYGLEKVYSNYDVDHESHANIKTYMYKVIHNCVLTELGKEKTALGVKYRDGDPFDYIQDGNGPMSGFRDYIEYGYKNEKKEDLIAHMLQCVKKMGGVDQVIVTCWMNYPKRNYTEMALDELEWEDNVSTRRVVNVRLLRATERLRKQMAKFRDDYFDIYASSEKKQEGRIPKNMGVDYNFIRRRRRAAKKSITRRIDYVGLVQTLTASLPD